MAKQDILFSDLLLIENGAISFSATIQESVLLGSRPLSSMHFQLGSSVFTVEMNDYMLDALQAAIDAHRKNFKLKKNEFAELKYKEKQGVLSL